MPRDAFVLNEMLEGTIRSNGTAVAGGDATEKVSDAKHIAIDASAGWLVFTIVPSVDVAAIGDPQ